MAAYSELTLEQYSNFSTTINVDETGVKVKLEKNRKYNQLERNNHKILNTKEIKDEKLLNNILNSMQDVYNKYCDYKGFENSKKDFLNFKLNENIFLFICLNEKDELCAFDICYEINNILYTPIYAWDYINPKLSILNLLHSEEIRYCMQNNIPFLYNGEGYESWGIYKAEEKGFQWWTGNEWSEDKEKYIKLCIKDETAEE